jgi:UDP-N-acetylglucosamine/UDP-N-acetylgalactosamine 4-epimerase
MKILVTGAAGFIGSHLTRALLEEGFEVRGLDDLSTGHERNLPKAQEGWSFVKGDIRLESVCVSAAEGMDAVVHLAGRNSVPRSIADPRSAMEVNVMGGFNLLEAARSHGCSRFIHASSSSVYGDDPSLPKLEEQKQRPLSPYAASKASFEHIASAWTKSWGMHTVGLRFFNVFGPRQDPDSAYAAVVPLFIRAALDDSRAKIYGDGTRSRDFTHVSNVVHAIRLSLDAPEDAAGEVFNIACGGRITVLGLWEAIAEYAGCKKQPIFMDPRPSDMPHSQAGIEKAQAKLGYSPVTEFDEGINGTVEWYRVQREEGQ